MSIILFFYCSRPVRKRVLVHLLLKLLLLLFREPFELYILLIHQKDAWLSTIAF